MAHYDPTSETYWRADHRCGGPIFPDISFQEVYNELYLKSGGDDMMDEENKSCRNDESQAEPGKKKRGRKPKSYYIQQQE
mmetsp:Transcript_39659/g.60748  ORF Transcript_39659/g.60748 Transcript_39659/m.60748 type:complete len:80 (-) Transcript_39659:2116-2355(-)